MDHASNTDSAEPAQAIQPLGKWRVSMLLTKQSFALLKQDKEVLLFPILSSLVSLAVAAGFIAGGVLLALQGNISFEQFDAYMESPSGEMVPYAMFFVWYLTSVFIVTFFQAGLTAIVYARLQGQNYGFRDGMRVAWSNVARIFLWSLIAATVGVLLRFIADRSKLLGKIVVALLGVAWSVLIFFIVPVLVVSKGTLKDAFHESGDTFRKTWGETIIVNFSIGLIMMLFGLAGAVLFVGTLFTMDIRIIVVSLLLMILYFLVLGVISSSLNAIVKVVLFHFARTGSVPAGFDPTLVRQAVRSR